jgi:hypothetical protein
VEIERQDALILAVAGTQERRTCAVGEDHGDVPPLGRHQHPRGLHLRPHYQHPAVLSGANPAIGHRERVDESAALGADVDRGDGADRHGSLEEDAVSRREVVGGGGGVDDGVHLGRRDVRHLQRPVSGRQGQIHPGFPLSYVPALLDPGAGPDPLVAGLHHPGEIVVGDDPVGHGEAGAEKTAA